jgi:hypothetical protein
VESALKEFAIENLGIATAVSSLNDDSKLDSFVTPEELRKGNSFKC